MVSKLDAESKNIMGDILYTEQSRALDEYRTVTDQQVQAMAETRDRVESEARAMATQHTEQMVHIYMYMYIYCFEANW